MELEDKYLWKPTINREKEKGGKWATLMTELVIFFSLFELQVKRKQYKWLKNCTYRVYRSLWEENIPSGKDVMKFWDRSLQSRF